jgi:hypothetical protein
LCDVQSYCTVGATDVKSSLGRDATTMDEIDAIIADVRNRMPILDFVHVEGE